ncbi:MAG: hypothetical protein JW841_08690 [Deltaproteobacteria bacterium]|nr:hypothetical protein [Deltaproteobacteria bacterium]
MKLAAKKSLVASDTDSNPQEVLDHVMLLGSVVQVDPEGNVWVKYAGHMATKARVASTLSLSASENVPVMLYFAEKQLKNPIVLYEICERLSVNSNDLAVNAPIEQAVVDGKTITLKGSEEIRLTCGKSSVILNKNGRLIIKGVEVISRASKTNKIKGGSVRIN